MNIQIRHETADDVAHIDKVTESAFRNAPHTDHNEQFVIKALRANDALVVSLVAEVDGKVIGHVAISPVSIADGAANWLGLGPISVLPEYQGKGVGSRLMETALAEIASRGASGCVVLGDPGYYERFGFRVIEGLVFPGAPPEYFQAVSFGLSYAQGEVTYDEAFLARG